MLSKCANPSCAEKFRYLGKGRLFRLEADPVSRSYTSHPESMQEEYFWICPKCSERMALTLDDGGHVTVIALPHEAMANPAEFSVVARMEGMMLRSVSSVRTRHKMH